MTHSFLPGGLNSFVNEGQEGCRGRLQVYSFFKLGARWWVVNATPRLLYPRDRDPITFCIGGWLGPRAGLDEYGKSRPPHRDSIPGNGVIVHKRIFSDYVKLVFRIIIVIIIIQFC